MLPGARLSSATPLSLRRLLVALLVLAGGFSVVTPPATAADVGVAVIDDDFQPAVIAIAPGDVVTWTNTGVRVHNVVAVDGLWTSPRLPSGDTFSRSFDTPGSFAYLCTIHPWMAGRVEVAARTAASAPATVAPPTSAPAATTTPTSAPAVSSPAAAQPRRYSPSFIVDGEVRTAYTFTLADLQALPSEEVAVEFTAAGQLRPTVYRGVRLIDLINLGGPRIAEPRAQNVLLYAVLVTAVDGSQVVVSWDELDPTLAATPALVAFEENGQPLGEDDGMARLVVPGDGRGGRYVSNITTITLVRQGAP